MALTHYGYYPSGPVGTPRDGPQTVWPGSSENTHHEPSQRIRPDPVRTRSRACKDRKGREVYSDAHFPQAK
jgi:hypothetical protein